MKEEWRDIPGWEGYYQISDLGRVRSLDRVVKHYRGGPKKLKGRILKDASRNRFGHLGVHLYTKGAGRSVYVHQLVALAWLGPCPAGQQVRHGPNGVMDNSVSNLCYGTPSEDGLDKRRDGTHGGRAVRRSDGVEFINQMVAAEESGCRTGSICNVCKGKYKTAGGYGWEYA